MVLSYASSGDERKGGEGELERPVTETALRFLCGDGNSITRRATELGEGAEAVHTWRWQVPSYPGCC